MQIFVYIPLLFQKVYTSVRPPRGPVMAGKNDVISARETINSFVNEVCPGFGVAHLRPSQGVEVMHGVRAVFGHAKGPVFGEEEVHLSRSFGVRGQLELYFQAVNRHLLARFGDVVGWLNKCDQPG